MTDMNAGMDDTSSSTLCIGMCLFKNKNGISYVFTNLVKIYKSNIFSRIRFTFVYEHRDDAVDYIAPIIRSFSNLVPNAIVDVIPNTRPWEPVRQRNIGHARNTFLDHLRGLRSTGVTFSHFAFMDVNDYACIGPIDTAVLKGVVQLQDQWDSVSFLREAGYYDMWALSFAPYVHSFFHFKSGWRDVLGRMRTAFDRVVTRAIMRGYELLPVFSAFNGFAIYRCAVYLSEQEPRIRYTDDVQTDYYPPGMLNEQSSLVESEPDGRSNDDCEHRYFHMVSMQPPHNARIFIYLKSLFKRLKPHEVPVSYKPRGAV